MMDQNEIIRDVIDLLEQHRSRPRGFMDQGSYKGDFFRLFRNAYEHGYMDERSHPRLTADALSDILATRWLSGDDQDEKKQDLIAELCAKWREWRYAWDHIEPR